MGSDSKHDIEYLKFILPDLGDLDVEEVLAQQESVYHYIKNNRQRDSGFGHGESSNNNTSKELRAFMESQMDYDEALARALEMDFGLNQMHISHPRTAADYTRLNVAETHIEGSDGQNGGQDNEELQSLGDLKKLKSQLPISKYKIKSSKNKEKEECVICCMEFTKGVEVTTFPCGHYFHPICANKCLEFSKNCPVCQKEVQ